MKNIRKFLSAVIVLISFSVNAAHAFVVDFENLSVLDIPSTFVAQPDYASANSTFRLIGIPFGDQGGISFSGGILLEDPTNSEGVSIVGDGGSVYYGTAFSPSTSILTTGYQNLIAINIANTELVSSVQGSFVHGLNTLDLDGPGISIGYTVSYFLEGVASPIVQNLSAIFTDGDEVVNFGFDSSTLMGAAMGALITGVEIVADGYDFINSNQDVDEFDFLLGSVRFNEGASPVPVPAALPLFISALLGGLVIARPKKKA